MLLFTLNPKIDTKGHCYTLALQQILTGVYIAELCLIGLFGLRSATGPSIVVGVLFLATVLFNATTNRYFTPLEKFLPADLAAEEDSEGEPLLSNVEEGQTESHVYRLGSHTPIPPKYLSPLARFFEPRIFASHRAMRAWIHEGHEWDEDNVPKYNEEQLRKAYLDPAFASQTPVVWIPRDNDEVSKKVIGELERKDVECTDEGAWLDVKGKLQWSADDFGQVPVFKEGVRW